MSLALLELRGIYSRESPEWLMYAAAAISRCQKTNRRCELDLVTLKRWNGFPGLIVGHCVKIVDPSCTVS